MALDQVNHPSRSLQAIAQDIVEEGTALLDNQVLPNKDRTRDHGFILRVLALCRSLKAESLQSEDDKPEKYTSSDHQRTGFFHLPLEIRDVIYVEIIGDRRGITWDVGHRYKQDNSKLASDWIWGRTVRNLLSASPLIRRRVCDIYQDWKLTVAPYSDIAGFLKCTRNWGPELVRELKIQQPTFPGFPCSFVPVVVYLRRILPNLRKVSLQFVKLCDHERMGQRLYPEVTIHISEASECKVRYEPPPEDEPLRFVETASFNRERFPSEMVYPIDRKIHPRLWHKTAAFETRVNVALEQDRTWTPKPSTKWLAHCDQTDDMPYPEETALARLTSDDTSRYPEFLDAVLEGTMELRESQGA